MRTFTNSSSSNLTKAAFLVIWNSFLKQYSLFSLSCLLYFYMKEADDQSKHSQGHHISHFEKYRRRCFYIGHISWSSLHHNIQFYILRRYLLMKISTNVSYLISAPCRYRSGGFKVLYIYWLSLVLWGSKASRKELKPSSKSRYLPLQSGGWYREQAHPISSHFPLVIPQVALFLQWLQLLE